MASSGAALCLSGLSDKVHLHSDDELVGLLASRVDQLTINWFWGGCAGKRRTSPARVSPGIACEG